MMKIALAGTAALLVAWLWPGQLPRVPSHTTWFITVTEETNAMDYPRYNNNVHQLPTGSSPFQIGVASDGESPFDPYGFGATPATASTSGRLGNISFQLNPRDSRVDIALNANTDNRLGFSQLITARLWSEKMDRRASPWGLVLDRCVVGLMELRVFS